MRDIQLRNTGNSILITLVNTRPGEIISFSDEVKLTISEWQEFHNQSQVDSMKPGELEKSAFQCQTSPDDYFKPCSYLVYGPWNYLLLTIVNEQGLGSQLAFTGFTQDQLQYNVTDVGLVIPGYYNKNSEHYEAIPEYTYLQEIAERLKISYSLRLSEISKVHADKYSNNYKKFNESGMRISVWPHENSPKKSEFILTKFFSINLSHIYSGNHNLWPEKYSSFDAVKKNHLNRHKDHLLCIVQITISDTIKLRFPSCYKSTIYCLILKTISEKMIFIKENDDVSFVRVLLGEGLCDFAILFRGVNIAAIYSIVERLTSLHMSDLYNFISHTSTPNLNNKKDTDSATTIKADLPLFEFVVNTLNKEHSRENNLLSLLSYTLYCCPSSHLEECFNEMRKSLERIHSGIKNSKNQPDINKEIHLLKTTYVSYKNLIQFKNEFRSNSNSSAIYRTIPITLIGVKAAKKELCESMISFWKSLTEIEADIISNLSGRYDYLIEFKCKSLSEFIISHQLLKWLLIGLEYYHCSSDENKETPLIFRKLRSCILELSTCFSFSIESKKIRKDETNFPFSNNLKSHKRIFRHQNLRIIGIDFVKETKLYLNNCLYNIDNANFMSPTINALIESRKDNKSVKALTDRIRSHIKDNILRYIKIAEKLCTNYSQNSSKANIKQHSFLLFLDECFEAQLSHEIKENLFTLIKCIDSGLSDSFSYYYNIDIYKYTKDLILNLLTLTSVEYHNIFLFSFDSRNNEIIMQWPDVSNSSKKFAGIESWVYNMIEILQNVTTQRQIGFYQMHEKNQIRVSDMRIINSKKIVGLSWFINTMIQKAVIDFKNNLSTNNKQPKHHTSYLNKLPQYLALFSNGPDAEFSNFSRTMHINARELTCCENLLIAIHEMGHALIEFLQLQDHCQQYIKSNKTSSAAVNYANVALDLINGTTSSQAKSSTLKHAPPQDQASSQKESFSNELEYIAKEVAADLFCYSYCYKTAANEAAKRANNLKKSKNQFNDKIHIFIAAYFFNIIRLPQIQNSSSLEKLLKRLMVVFLTLKSLKSTNISFFETIRTVALAYEKATSNGSLGETWRKYLNAMNNLINKQVDTTKEFIFLKELPNNCNEILNYIRQERPVTTNYFKFLSNNPTPPLLSKMLSDNPALIHSLGFGHWPIEWDAHDFNKQFEIAAQIIGGINVIHLLHLLKGDLHFLHGFPFIKQHFAQQHISRLRSQVIQLIWHGSLHKIKNEFEPINKKENQ